MSLRSQTLQAWLGGVLCFLLILAPFPTYGLTAKTVQEDPTPTTKTVDASPTFASILGISHYDVTETATHEITVDLVTSDGTSNESQVLTYAAPDGVHHGQWTVTHQTDGIQDVQFQLTQTDMVRVNENRVDSSLQTVLTIDGQSFVTEVDVEHNQTQIRQDANWTFVRYTFGPFVFERFSDSYEPTVDDPAFQQWLIDSGAQALLDDPRGERLITIVRDPAVYNETPLAGALIANLGTTTTSVSNHLVAVAEEDDHGKFATGGQCAICVACAASGWGGLVGCAGCVVACLGCGWAIGEEL